LCLVSSRRTIDVGQLAHSHPCTIPDADRGSFGHCHRYADGNADLDGYFLADAYANPYSHAQPPSYRNSYCDGYCSAESDADSRTIARHLAYPWSIPVSGG
jgi:hypothetical protein